MFIDWFAQQENKALLKKFEKLGVVPKAPKRSTKKQSLQGKTFVLTGELDAMTRDAAKAEIKARGGSVSSSVSKKTDYVVVGANPGSKATKAESLGVPMLDEAAFKKLLK